MDFINISISDKSFSKKMYFGIVSDELANEIKNRFDIDTHDYNLSLNGQEIRKIIKKHGNEKTEALRGQRAVRAEDFCKIPFVLSRPTDIIESGRYEGKPCFIFKRDGISVVGVVTRKHLDLFVQTMYISKKNRSLATPPSDETSSRTTSETPSGTASDNIIRQNSEEINQYSDRETVSIYDLMGENKALKKQNAQLSEDVSRLKERLALERQVTKGNRFNVNQLQSAARHLIKLANSEYAIGKMVEDLNDVYSYIVQTPNLVWDELMARCAEVARKVLTEQKGMKIENEYFKMVKDEIRKTRISLSEDQIQEAKLVYGEKYRNAFMGRVILAKDGIRLDQKWQEWAAMYPDIFDAEITGGDQITALSDIYDDLRDSSEIYQRFNDEESIRSLAAEIYNQYWNVSTIQTTADKYDKRIKRLNFEHRNAMKELRDDYKQRLSDQKKSDAEHYKKIIRKVRNQKYDKVKEAKESGRDKMREYKDRLERNKKVQKITRNALTLNRWLTENSKSKHVPEIMKKPVAYLLSSIDFSSKQLLGLNGGSRANTPTKQDVSLSEALEQVYNMVHDINSAQIGESEITEIYGTFVDFPKGFADNLKELSKQANNVMRTVGDNEYVLNQMTLEQLDELDKIITIIKSTVSSMNDFLSVSHAEGVAHLSQKSIEYMNSLGKGKTHDNLLGKVEKLRDWGNALPYYTFRRFGEGGQKIFEAMQDGWDKFSFLTKQIIEYAETVYTSKEVKVWEQEVKTFEVLEPISESVKNERYKPKVQKLQMSVPQIMSLYCLQKREQAKSHLMGGGMRIADIQTKKSTISQPDGIILGEKEINTIINTLTARQMEVADKLQEFMNTICSDWGNEISMKRFGYKAFGEKNYFPIQSDKNNLAVNDETEQNNSMFRLLNMSFTKSLTKNANNRIVISSIFDVFAQHTTDMAKYNSLALPVLDAFKWYNYTEKVQVGDTQFRSQALKQAMEKALGKDAQNYFVTFIKDINGERNVGRDSVGTQFFTNAKIASVGANLRVVALQPTSFVRAVAVINPKYLINGVLSTYKIKKAIGLAKKYCGMALWKSMGFYDTNIQRGVAELIKHDTTVKDKAVEISMKGAEKADEFTWGALWMACESEVKAKNKNLKVASEEYYTAVGKRLRDIIYATQVVDSTMTRSHIMRSSDGMDKALTSFMSEPTLSFNMLQDVCVQWSLTSRQHGGGKEGTKKAFKKHGTRMGRVLAAYTVTNIFCAAVEAGFDILRDEENEEEFMKMFGQNFKFDMGIIGKIPYMKEIISLFQGYESSRTDTQWMQYMVKTYEDVVKILNGKGDAYKTWKDLLRTISYVSGLPFYNLWRDAISILNKKGIIDIEELKTISILNKKGIIDIEELKTISNETLGEIYPSLKEE